MAPRFKSRSGYSSQALDREVHQVVRKLIDNHEQYDGTEAGNFSMSTEGLCEAIKRSNSSLSRRPNKVLEDSIDRVLKTIQQDNDDSASEPMNGQFDDLDTGAPSSRISSNGLNRSIVGQWSTSVQENTVDKEQSVHSKRGTDGQRPLKRRKTNAIAIDRSPSTHVSLEDLGGVDHVVRQFKDLLVMPLTQPEVYISTGIQPPRGVLIHGPPGCGKTMIANAVAADLGVNFIPISAPSIVSGMSGESEKALRDHFEEAKRIAPCLMFIDEIDAITPKREGAQREMEKRIVAQLLTCMDDLSLEKTDRKPVIILAATNRPDSLDAALRRGGRFDKEINMTVPSEPVREQILRALTRKLTLEPGIDFALLAKRTPGFVGADLNDLVSTAGSAAIMRFQNTLESQAQIEVDESNMSVDGVDIVDPASDSQVATSTSLISPEILSFKRLVKYSKGHPMHDHIDPSRWPVQITFDDFLTALPQIQPSSLREGFTTIPSTTFDDIGSLSIHISELKNTIISPIVRPDIYTSTGLAASSGTLLWGPPGNGKTLLAKAVANASQANFISVKGPELLNKYVGESERAVRQVFNRARSSVPVVIFFDELDALVPRRDGATSEASARVVNTLLTELDGVGHSRQGIYVMGATNRPDLIDPAMTRPGRFETLLYIGLPDAEGRVDILKTICKRLKNFTFTDEIAQVARQCERFSGADMESLVRRAGYSAIKRHTRTEEITSTRPVNFTIGDFEFARTEVRPSVSVVDMRRYEQLQRELGETTG